jgi:hypothetical protein
VSVACSSCARCNLWPRVLGPQVVIFSSLVVDSSLHSALYLLPWGCIPVLLLFLRLYVVLLYSWPIDGFVNSKSGEDQALLGLGSILFSKNEAMPWRRRWNCTSRFVPEETSTYVFFAVASSPILILCQSNFVNKI